MSAAKARNQGFAWLLKKDSTIQCVQFLDGDCTLDPGWIEAAVCALADDPGRAAVIGHIQERDPDATPYNKLCAMEWRSAPGDVNNYGAFGGISMMRADAFSALGGFRPDVIAGEDSELGVRIALAGYKMTKLDVPMAVHDADMRTFHQWWKRAVRAGHAIGQRSDIHGKTVLRDCVRERNSTVFWGIGLPLLILSTIFSTQGASLLLLIAYPILGVRIWRYRRKIGDRPADALLYAAFLLIAKFANAVGLLKFAARKTVGRYEIIEYK
jgi:cellulose synthase/poly-beta-1,6-N-acetylglucosamine synthase-like glycosyltransferase